MELMAFAYLAVSPPSMSRQFEEVAIDPVLIHNIHFSYSVKIHVRVS